jgi:type VI secretion system protein VasD
MSTADRNPKRIDQFLYAFGAVVLVVLTLAGCAASGPKAIEIKGDADRLINRDASGKPLSVVVRVYQLKDAGEFSKMTFDTLASGRPESELLGQDLLEKSEVILVPGGQYAGTEKIREDTKYVGVVALFRQPDQHYWRWLVAADQVRSDGLRFRVQECYLALSNPKPTAIPGQPADAKPVCAPRPLNPAQAAGRSAPLPQKRSSVSVTPTR